MSDWQEWAKSIAALWAVLGPILILPAIEALRRFWRDYRRLRADVGKVLRVIRILANRERRQLDILRRLVWAIRYEEKRGTISHETIEVLGQLQRETDDLRDTAWRSPELRKARLEQGQIMQGEVDANPLQELSEGERDA